MLVHLDAKGKCKKCLAAFRVNRLIRVSGCTRELTWDEEAWRIDRSGFRAALCDIQAEYKTQTEIIKKMHDSLLRQQKEVSDA